MHKTIRILSLFILSILVWPSAQAAYVDTVATYSPSMGKKIKAVVITPDAYAAAKALPVVYLLHGYSGNYTDYVKNTPWVKEAADMYHFIIVCPDGNFNSWYLDSPIDKDSKYETYVSDELVKWIYKNYKNYKTVKDRSGRAIIGLSMGGHGALYLAFRHQDVFGAAGSISGGVDLRPFPNNWDLAAKLGPYAQFPERWEQNSVINMVYLLTPDSLKLIIDCGSDDFFFRVNQNLHAKLLERNIPHGFITRPGGHSWDYWGNSIHYQLLLDIPVMLTPVPVMLTP